MITCWCFNKHSVYLFLFLLTRSVPIFMLNCKKWFWLNLVVCGYGRVSECCLRMGQGWYIASAGPAARVRQFVCTRRATSLNLRHWDWTLLWRWNRWYWWRWLWVTCLATQAATSLPSSRSHVYSSTCIWQNIVPTKLLFSSWVLAELFQISGNEYVCRI